MLIKKEIIDKIKQEVSNFDPAAQVILYGSHARGNADAESDYDLLILVEEELPIDRINKLRHRLYEIEWADQVVLSVIIRSKSSWNHPRLTASPFRKNVLREGILL